MFHTLREIYAHDILSAKQVSGMMGLNANQEDMFSKLEEMRSVITEVNNQFKDPVRML